MKNSIFALCIVLCALCLSTANAERTPEQCAEDLQTLTNRILRLEHGDDILDALPRWAEREGISPDELSGELVLAAVAMGKSPDRESRIAREMAIGALGFCGTTNAIPYLESLVRSESGSAFDGAMNALMVLTKANAREVASVHRIVTQERGDDPGSLYGFYREMAHVLKWRELEPARAAQIRILLLKTAEASTDWADVADEILCAHVAGYAKSEQRRMNLARALSVSGQMIRARTSLEKAAADLAAIRKDGVADIPDLAIDFGPKYPEPDKPEGK